MTGGWPVDRGVFDSVGLALRRMTEEIQSVADALAASVEELERSRPPVHVPPGVAVPVGRRRRRYGRG